MSALSTKKTPLSWVFKGWVVFLNLKREESFGAFHLGMTLDFCQQRGKAGKKGVRLFFCWRPAQHNQLASWGTIPKRRRRGSNRQKAWGASVGILYYASVWPYQNTQGGINGNGGCWTVPEGWKHIVRGNSRGNLMYCQLSHGLDKERQ